MANLYIHCGLPKTGSTTLQNYLASSTEDLDEWGVLYPCSGRAANTTSHLKLANALGFGNTPANLRYTNEFCTRLEQEMSESGKGCAVLSCEVFSKVNETSIENGVENAMRSIIDRFDTTFIFYLRRPVDWLESMHNQLFRKGRIHCDIDTFVDEPSTYLSGWPIDFVELFEFYSKFCGDQRVAVRLFDKGFLSGGDLLTDFAALFGASVRKGDVKSYAESLDRGNVIVQKGIYDSFVDPKLISPANAFFLSDIIAGKGAITKLGKSRVSGGAAAEIYSRYEAMYREIMERWAGGGEFEKFYTQREKVDSDRTSKVNFDQVKESQKAVWVVLDRLLSENRRLKQEVEQLKGIIQK